MEVFNFLETLYGAFDKIALRRKVFKIETVRAFTVHMSALLMLSFDGFRVHG